jgi:hypothetical protein
LSEIPVHFRPRRLSDWINPTGAKKVHSLIDKVYKRKNLEMAWEKVQANRGSGGVDGQTLEEFSAQLDQQLDRLHRELQEDVYQPRPVRQVQIPKVGKPGEYRKLGIPTIYDRVCQQALLNRLEPIFEPIFDEASFGYRRGRSTQDAMRKVWKEIQSGRVSWLYDQAGPAATQADASPDPKRGAGRGLICVPEGKIDPSLYGSGARAHQAAHSSDDLGTDRGPQPCNQGMGELLQTCPRPKALQPTQRLDRTAHPVAPMQAVA